MLRESRRFTVQDEQGRLQEVVEVAAYFQLAGVEVLNGVPTMMTMTGAHLFPCGATGSYTIPRHGLIVHEIR